jgi:acyl-coenzyme A thioesterase PaaI-like protein
MGPRLVEAEMTRSETVSAEVLRALTDRLGSSAGRYRIPPPVFIHMQGEFMAVDVEAGTLTARFPLFEHYLNPYDRVQGGMIAAAVDNTLGPLSMLVAPPNVTRRLEMIYSRPVSLEMRYINVAGRLLEREGRQLVFAADVLAAGGVRLARARATHWIVLPEAGGP